MSVSVINKKNFELLIDIIEDQGPMMIEQQSDMIEDHYHTKLSHTKPDLIRCFAHMLSMKADLIEAVELSEKYRDETCLIGEPNKFIVEKIRKDLNGLDLRNPKNNEPVKFTDKPIKFTNSKHKLKIN